MVVTLFRPALTAREAEVVRLMNSWLTNREIAAELSISENTVKTHARAVYMKLGVTNRRDAVECAHQQGII
jgi:LuxR family maltose regulon positive regulatory protein